MTQSTNPKLPTLKDKIDEIRKLNPDLYTVLMDTHDADGKSILEQALIHSNVSATDFKTQLPKYTAFQLGDMVATFLKAGITPEQSSTLTLVAALQTVETAIRDFVRGMLRNDNVEQKGATDLMIHEVSLTAIAVLSAFLKTESAAEHEARKQAEAAQPQEPAAEAPQASEETSADETTESAQA